MRSAPVSVFVLGLAAAATPVSAGTVTLFGQEYDVQRVDYFNEMIFDNPRPGYPDVGMLEVEGSRYLGNNHLLLASEKMAGFTYKTICVDAELQFDAGGHFTGFGTVEVVFWQHPPLPGQQGYDLSPSGLTVNTGSTGLGAGGNLVVSDTENQGLHAYNIATGQRIPWPHDPPLPPTDPFWDGWSILAPPEDPNAGMYEPEDVVYVPQRDLFYLVQEDDAYLFGGFLVARFQTNGTFVDKFPTPSVGGPRLKGLACLEDVAAFPCPFHGLGGVLMLSWDDNHDGGNPFAPGLDIYDLDGNWIAYENLLEDLDVIDPGFQMLNLESISVDPVTGRLFLVQQGDVTLDNYLYILTPVPPTHPGDLDGNQAVNSADALLFLPALAGPDVTTPPGGVAPATFSLADVDEDCDVDLRDTATFQDRFGS